MKRKGFTVIELLVVIAICAILISVIVTGVQRARGGATQSQERVVPRFQPQR